MTTDFWADAEIIHAYTRAQALADGELVDAGPAAREAGFIWPVAMTRSVWVDCVQWDEGDRERKPGAGQDEAGRLWDVLSMARFAIKRTRPGEGGQRLEFEVLRVPRTGRGLRPQLVHLVLVCGPGDDAEPVVTIMTAGED